MNEEDLNKLSSQIIQAAIEVHKELGPGLLEGVYEECLAKEFDRMGITYKRQLEIQIPYKGEYLAKDKNFRVDFLVEDEVIVENKSMESLLPKHEAQLLTYLRLAEKRLGLLINFNVSKLKNGVKRMRNGY